MSLKVNNYGLKKKKKHAYVNADAQSRPHQSPGPTLSIYTHLLYPEHKVLSSFSAGLDSASVFSFKHFFSFFFTRFRETKFTIHNYSSTVHALFIGPTVTLFKKNILKMGPIVLFTHFKNYFATVFSVTAKIYYSQL